MTLSEAERIEAFSALSDLMDALTAGFTVVGRIATLLAETPQPRHPESIHIADPVAATALIREAFSQSSKENQS